MNNAMTPAALETLIAALTVVAAGYVLEVVPGRLYAKIARRLGGSSNRSVYGFVDMRNGDLLKAASWKSPAAGARGNALTGDLSRCGAHGIG